MNHIVLDPTTELRMAVIGWKSCSIDKLPGAADRLMEAGAAYGAARARGDVPARRYTEQLAFAAQHCSASRPHERDMAIEQISEIEALSRDELRAESAAEKRAKGSMPEPRALDPNRHDVRLGLIGGGE